MPPDKLKTPTEKLISPNGETTYKPPGVCDSYVRSISRLTGVTVPAPKPVEIVLHTKRLYVGAYLRHQKRSQRMKNLDKNHTHQGDLTSTKQCSIQGDSRGEIELTWLNYTSYQQKIVPLGKQAMMRSLLAQWFIFPVLEFISPSLSEFDSQLVFPFIQLFSLQNQSPK